MSTDWVLAFDFVLLPRQLFEWVDILNTIRRRGQENWGYLPSRLSSSPWLHSLTPFPLFLSFCPSEQYTCFVSFHVSTISYNEHPLLTLYLPPQAKCTSSNALRRWTMPRRWRLAFEMVLWRPKWVNCTQHGSSSFWTAVKPVGWRMAAFVTP